MGYSKTNYFDRLAGQRQYSPEELDALVRAKVDAAMKAGEGSWLYEDEKASMAQQLEANLRSLAAEGVNLDWIEPGINPYGFGGESYFGPSVNFSAYIPGGRSLNLTPPVAPSVEYAEGAGVELAGSPWQARDWQQNSFLENVRGPVLTAAAFGTLIGGGIAAGPGAAAAGGGGTAAGGVGAAEVGGASLLPEMAGSVGGPAAAGGGVGGGSVAAAGSSSLLPEMAGSVGGPAAAGGGGSSMASWGVPLATSILETGANLYGSYQQQQAIEDATKDSLKAQEKARQEAAATLLPYTATGQQTMGQLSGMTGQPFSMQLPSLQAYAAANKIPAATIQKLSGLSFDDQLAYAAAHPEEFPPALMNQFVTANAPTLRAYEGWKSGQTVEKPPEYQGYDKFAYSGEAPQFAFDPAKFLNDPSYQYRLKQSLGAVEGSAAGRGSLMSGPTLKALQTRGGEEASKEYGAAWNRALQDYEMARAKEATDYGRSLGEWQVRYGQHQDEQNIPYARWQDNWNRLASLANIGQTSSSQVSSQAIQAGSNAANMLYGAGENKANAIGARTESVTSGLTDMAQLYGWSQGKEEEKKRPNNYGWATG